MNIFLNTSSLHNLYPGCCVRDVGETIERDCLSVLHKLHDQVNGLQLVQVVVQPLAKLFNPASLAALVNVQQSNTAATTTAQSSLPTTPNANNSSTNSPANFPATPTSTSNIIGRNHANIGNNNSQDLDGISTHSASYAPASVNQSRSQSFASTFSGNNSGPISSNAQINQNNNSPLLSTSTYMMSPDTAQALIARLDTDRDINWLMEIIGYGLSMPFSLTGEQDSVKDCCTIYCEWLAAALLPYNEQNEDGKYQQLSKLVPTPIRSDPNRYARKMLSHLYNVFLPRQNPNPTGYSSGGNSQKEQNDANLTAVSRQAVLCHRVLRTIESIAQNQSNLMDNQTWDHLLALLLTVNDKLLSAPTEPDDIGTQLHDRILGVLFDLMLLASCKYISDPSLWKTFHEMCLNWRHRPALVDHWRRVTLSLTKRIVSAPSTHKTNIQQLEAIGDNSSAIEQAILSMNSETLAQTWFRFLNLIGNPVELSDPNVISRTEEFYNSACASDNVLDPRQHPCLNVLPQIFTNAMAGLKDFVEAFLGSYQLPEDKGEPINHLDRFSKSGSTSGSMSRNQQRPSLSSISSRTSQTNQVSTAHFKLSPERPRCNSILHIFGDWLFSAALIGSDLNQELNEPDDGNTSESTTSLGSASTTTEISGMRSYSPLSNRKQTSLAKSQTSSTRRLSQSSRQHDGSNSGAMEKITLDPPLSPESFEAGQSEAMAILCRVFSSKASSENILPTYLSRFYLCLQHCLSFGSGLDTGKSNLIGPSYSLIKRQLLASVLINSTTILQKDLDGINLLVPCFIRAIEFVFECSEKEIPIQAPPRQHNRSGSIRAGSNYTASNATSYDLRRSCIFTLMNLLAYPFHFQDLVIRNCLNESSPTKTFGSLRPRLLKILFVALQTETDPTNMQILFGGLSLTIHDLSINTNRLVRNSREDNSRSRHKNDSTSSNSISENNNSETNNNNQRHQDDAISQNSFVFNSKGGFLIKSLHVTCHLLINIWKHDTQVSLAALEILTTIARVSTSSGARDENDANQSSTNTERIYQNNNNLIEMRNEYKQTTKWICDYICNQCSRPPPAHSRDMHSTIVAAYQCLSVWFYNHPYLLNDENCISTLMEVIELGVCGQKSKITNLNASGLTNISVLNKGDKVMKPSSMRVREAAESLLNICMIRARIPDDIGLKITSYCDTVIDEQALIELVGDVQCKSILRHIQDPELKRIEAHKMFKYFCDEDSIIYGFFEGFNSETSSCKDSVLCLLRTPFGKHCWRMKFVYYSEKSKEKIIANRTLGLIKRPLPQVSTPIFEPRMFAYPTSGGAHNKYLYFNNSAKFFPDTIEVLPKNELDLLVTTLDDYMSFNVRDQKLKNDLDKISKIYNHQVLAEQKVLSECSVRIKKVDCEEPQSMNDMEAARVLATQLGLKFALNTLSENGDKVSTKFANDLKSLDHQSVRICDSVNIFYVRKNRTSVKEILESVRERHNVSLAFFEWILELGRPTVVKNHGRWTGKASNSWNSKSILLNHASMVKNQNSGDFNNDDLLSSRNQMLLSDHGGSIFDGERMTLYWSDMCQELAFMIPSKMEKIGCIDIIICWLECSDDLVDVPTDQLLSPPTTSYNSTDSGYNLDDSNHADNISTNAGRNKTNFAKYYISAMKNGLFRINLVTSLGRDWLALPLVDGMTVSKNILASLIRESVLNLCRRRRLDADSYQPPHVKRRLKVQDICNNYKVSSRFDSTGYYNNLFLRKIVHS